MIKILLLLTALALVQARPNDDAELFSGGIYEFHEDCPAAEIHFLLPHEYDCTKFYYCEYGWKYIAPRDCAPGTEFNADKQVCVHPINSGCTLPGFNTTPGGGGGGGGDAPSTTTAAPITPEEVTPEPTTSEAPIPEETTPEAATPGDDPDCEILDNGCPADFTIHQLLPHEEYCHKFYYCDKGELVLRYCAPGTYFNPKLQVCDWPQNVDCVNDGSYEYSTTSAPGTPPPPPPGDDDDIGDILDNGCPADFDVHHLLPHETECNKFYYCVFGEKVERSCAPGTYFNYEIQVCDWPDNVNCASSGTTQGGSSDEITPAPGSSDETTEKDQEGVTLPNGCPAAFDVHHLLPHETDCDKFYYCVNGQKIERGCAPGTHFNPIKQVCDWPQFAGCEHWDGCSGPGDDNGNCAGTTADDNEITPAPGSSDETTDKDLDGVTLPNGCPAAFDVHHLLPHETDCDKFYYCVDGQKVERGCAPGTHFNPNLQVCDWPQYAGCEHWDGCSGPGDDNGGCDTTTPVPDDEVTPPTGGSDEITVDSNESDDKTSDSGENDGTTPIPDCDACQPPPTPADKCKSGCNVLPFIHDNDCDKYWICNGDQPVLVTCSEGLHFNPSTYTCDFVCNAGCVRENVQITTLGEGVKLFLPWGSITSEMMDLLEAQIKADL